MSKRYEVGDMAADLEILGPGADLGQYALGPDAFALVIGNPWASAYAIEGSPEELTEFARRLTSLVAHTLPRNRDVGAATANSSCVIHDVEGRSDAERSGPVARLLALTQELDVDPVDLDDLVDDLVSNWASEINNGGMEAQIAYLLDQVGEAAAEQAIRGAASRAQR